MSMDGRALRPPPETAKASPIRASLLHPVVFTEKAINHRASRTLPNKPAGQAPIPPRAFPAARNRPSASSEPTRSGAIRRRRRAGPRNRPLTSCSCEPTDQALSRLAPPRQLRNPEQDLTARNLSVLNPDLCLPGSSGTGVYFVANLLVSPYPALRFPGSSGTGRLLVANPLVSPIPPPLVSPIPPQDPGKNAKNAAPPPPLRGPSPRLHRLRSGRGRSVPRRVAFGG